MNKTPLLEFVYNRKKTAATNREAAVELRITFERKQKYMTTGIRHQAPAKALAQGCCGKSN